jgi:hypothetical protein
MAATALTDASVLCCSKQKHYFCDIWSLKTVIHQGCKSTAASITNIDCRAFSSDKSNEEWIPPPPRVIVDTDNATQISVASASQQERQQQQLFKQQERIQKVYQEQEALLQLTEDEMKSLSDDEILSRVEKVLAMEEELEEKIFEDELEQEEQQSNLAAASASAGGSTTDWLQTRRAALGKSHQEEQSAIAVRQGELLTAEEIHTLLKSCGGTSLVTIMDDKDYPRMGGAHGMILCTAGGSDDDEGEDSMSITASSMITSPFLINTLARILIDHLKERQLGDLGVLGAQMGTNHLSPRGTASGGTASSQFSSTAQSQSTWHVVDCGNYIVHIMDAHTRASLKLEVLWSGKDPLWKLNFLDDDAVEEYCARHPVPASYNGGNARADSFGPWEASMIRRLEHNQYTSFSPKHHPVIPNATKRRDRQAGRRRKREQWQQKRRQQGQF